jgi:hypothetical protein
MITFTRDEAQKLLDSLAEAIDAQQWELDNHIKTHGEWFRPKRVEYMKDALANTLRTVELLSHKLNTPIEQIGITYEEANPPEPMIDGWPLYSGLPQPKKEWVGLTDEEIAEIRLKSFDSVATNRAVVKAIEAKLKEKNT